MSQAKKDVIASKPLLKSFGETALVRYKNPFISKDIIEWPGKNSIDGRSSGAGFQKGVDVNEVDCCARRPIPKIPWQDQGAS
jgi:hypothetical protein